MMGHCLGKRQRGEFQDIFERSKYFLVLQSRFYIHVQFPGLFDYGLLRRLPSLSLHSSSCVGGIIIYSGNLVWLWAMVTFRKFIFYLNVILGRTQP